MAKQSRRQYTEEFKREAVKLDEEQGRGIAEVSRGMGRARRRPRAGSSGATLAESRQHCARQLSRLPPELRALDASPSYPVEVSDRIRALAREADVRIEQMQLAGRNEA